MKTILIALASLTVFTCTATKPTTVKVTVVKEQAEDTGERKLFMQPGWIPDSDMQLSLERSDDMPQNTVHLTAILTNKCMTLEGYNIVFNVDNELYFFPPMDGVPNCRTNTRVQNDETIRKYVITVPFIEKLIKAKQVYVSLEYSEGDFSQGGFTSAKYGFKEFYAKVQQF